jgi:NifU-like protein
MLTDRVTGRTTAEAAEVAQHTALEGVEPRCAAVACEALLDAIREFSNAARDDWAGDEALICTCFFVSERTIEREIQAHGLTTVAEVTRACNAGAGCGSCHLLIEEILVTTEKK